MKRLLVFATAVSALLAVGAEVPEPVKPFVKEAERVFPEAGEFTLLKPGVYQVRDGNSNVLGSLYLETIGDSERQFGYAGTIEIAVLFDKEQRVAGVLIGKNQETPSFLNRVRAARFLESWNKLKMNEIPGKEVDFVTGATYSSSAIHAGVRKLAESYLKMAEDEKKVPVAPAAAAPAVPKSPEVIQLERRIAMLQRIVSGSQVLLKQLQERKEDELKLRLIAALEGPEAAQKFAKENKLMFFNHPGRGGKKSPVTLAAEKYKASKSEADLQALKAAILANYERMLQTVPPHNAEQEKALEAVKARLAMVLKQGGAKAPAAAASAPGKMKFRSPEAQEQEEKIAKLAAAYRQNRDPQVLGQLRKEVTRQLVQGTLAMSAAIEKKEQETARLKDHLAEFTRDPDAVIQKRLDALTK
ncbi:FMN-binding protein [Victivallis vadensis]|uniref:FMN-binding protein n=1 Tax=Victivallis vadensis TaxID=172901 RepID=A0A2U1B4B0_9BACT|nr:FMN-binding protein [Victivallis vadensis]NMD85023.1 FMN-binding protein [Victivallis vadensis]PVY43513.1 Na+-translocating ferredoxin:NAD+ oxidoreductase RnfG subunit [Victivallis vadensis]